MRLAKLINHSLLFTLVSTTLFASENILSTSQDKVFSLEKEIIKEESSQLRKDWINPINYVYSQVYSDNYDTSKSYISITQPIFKSGGIYKAIKYANAQENYKNISIDLQKKELITQATTLLFKLHKLDLSIKKQKLLVENSKIDIKRKTDQVKSGFLDASFLDNTLLDANNKETTLVDLGFQKVELENSFNNLSYKKYSEFKLPKLTLIKEQDFLDLNMTLLQNKASINTKRYFKDISVARFLPTIDLTANYTKYHDTNNPSIVDDSVTNYGFKITMPINFQTFNIITSAKLSYLKEKLNLENKKISQENFFKTKLAKINMLNQKIKISKNNYLLYEEILKSAVEEKNAGFKTQSDVETLMNSQKIKEVDILIYNYDKQIELLGIYSKINI